MAPSQKPSFRIHLHTHVFTVSIFRGTCFIRQLKGCPVLYPSNPACTRRITTHLGIFFSSLYAMCFSRFLIAGTKYPTSTILKKMFILARSFRRGYAASRPKWNWWQRKSYRTHSSWEADREERIQLEREIHPFRSHLSKETFVHCLTSECENLGDTAHQTTTGHTRPLRIQCLQWMLLKS